MSNRFTTYCTLLLMLLGSLRAFAQVDLTLGDLPAGETVTVVFEVTVDRLQTQTAITNQATVSSENLMDVLSDDPDTGALLDATITAIDAFADVGVDVIPAENPVDASSLVLLDLLVSNAGPHDTTGVVVTNQLPIGVTFDAANSSSNIVELGGGLLEIVLGDLAADAMTNLTIQVSIDDCCQAGFLTNRAGVVHLVTDTNAVNDTHTLAVAVLPDTVPPVITACLTNLFFGCNPGEGTIPEPSPSEIMATDTCGPVTTLFVGEVLSTNGCLVTLTRTYAAVDRCNNSNTCEQLLTWIEDFDAPTFAQCAPDEDLGCNPSIIPPADTNAVAATDACGGVAISLFSEETVTNGCDVVLTRVYMAFDDCGNSSTCTQVVNWVEDLEPPTMNGCPPGMDLGCNPQEIPAPDPSSLGAFDSCGAVAITNIDVLETNGCKVALTRTYVVTDMCGNSNTCSHVLSWSEDTEAPQFTSCAPDMDLGCNPTNIPSADLMAVIATDNCGISDVVLDDETIVTNGFAVMLTRTYLATDGCGNSNTCLQTITWRQDFDAPEIIEFVQDLDLGCNPTNIPPADTNAVVAIDVYGVATVLVLDEVTTTNGCEVTMLRTYQVLDACGNSSNRVQTISWVEDLLPPVIAACPEPIDLGCNPAIPAIPAMDTNLVSATDDCGDVSVSLFSEATATNGCDVTFTRTYLVTDACGNTNSCDEIFTYREDLEAPVITRCAPDMDLGCNPTNIPPADPLSVVATDNCGVSDISLAGEVLSTNGCQMSLSRTYLVLDGCGNSNVCVQTLTWIEDLEAPSVTSCPADVDLGCNPTLPTPDVSLVSAEDDCGSVVVVHESDLSVTNGCTVTLTRTYRAFDPCSNSVACVQVLTYTNDLANPVFASAPDFVTVAADENCIGIIPDVLSSVVASDDCGTVMLSQSPAAGSPVQGLEVPDIVVTATDVCGNASITNIAVVVDCLAGLSLVKQVYVGHDAGASCSGQSLIIGTNNTPITFCFTLENTGTVHLANLVLEDALLPGFVPITIDTLAVGASTSVYYETVIAGSVTNLAMATGVPAYVADPLNLNGARARPSNILPGPNVVAMGAAVVLARGQISDTVWLDVNRDGIPNENLDGMGLAGVTVNLYTLNLRGVRTFVTNTMTQAVPGNGGFYLFTNLVAATYLVEIDGNTLPPIFRFPTRPASQVFVMAAGQVVANADFGFISTPTAITLASFDAQAIPAGIQVDWATGSERNNLGFNIYRSQTINGLRTRMNSDLISGQGTGVGARYGLLDAVTETGTYFYWLEDVDYDEQSKLHGPVTATIAATPQVLDAGRVGIHRAPAGIVKIDGQAVPVILTDDGVLFYLADATAEVTLSEGAPDVMSLVDASPDGGEALQLIIAENGLARFTTETGFTVYLVIGFEAAPIVLDVSDPLAPIQVNGAVLERAEETGVYLSYPAAAELNAEVVK